jgi:hypothetical protein
MLFSLVVLLHSLRSCCSALDHLYTKWYYTSWCSFELVLFGNGSSILVRFDKLALVHFKFNAHQVLMAVGILTVGMESLT